MVYNWIINALLFCLAPISYMCFQLYKDNVELRRKNEYLNKHIDNLLEEKFPKK